MLNSSALALGIGVTPGKMYFSVRPGDSETKTLHVINQSDQQTEFRIYIEDEEAEWISITPDRFMLDARNTENVEILVSPPLLTTPQECDFPICVVSIPPDSDLSIGAGIKLSTHLLITELPVMAIQWWIASASIIVIVIIGLLLLWWRKRRHAKENLV
jgi:P pilus assembly chaperone PapD